MKTVYLTIASIVGWSWSAWAASAASWVPAASMVTPRWGASAAVLANGDVVVSGGWDGERDVASAEIFNPGRNLWSEISPLNEAREFACSVQLTDGRVLVVGGADYSLGVALSSAEIFDPESQRFALTWPMAEPRQDAGATRLADGRILVIGGSNGVVRLKSAEIYDPATERWSSTAEMSVARSGHIAVTLADGRVLVAGGGPQDWVAHASAEIFDPTTETWSPTGSLSCPRLFAGVARRGDGRILVAGGTPGDTNVLDSIDVFDPRTDRFAPIGALTSARYGASPAELRDGSVAFLGGNAAFGASSAVDRLGGVGFPALGSARSFPVTVVLPAGAVLVAGGADRFVPLASAEIFGAEPVIASMPSDLTLCPGQSAQLSIGATGVAPLHYRWLKNGMEIAGIDSPSLTIAAAEDDAGRYQVEVSNPYGVARSTEVAVRIATLPALDAGQDASTTVGTPLGLRGSSSPCAACRFAWALASNPDGGARLLETADPLRPTFSADRSGTYVCRLMATSFEGCPAAPSDVSIVVKARLPVISAQPESIRACAGDTAAFHVAVDEPVSYQWLRNGLELLGESAATLIYVGVTRSNAGTYSCRVTNSAGSAISAEATLTVDPIPVASAGPSRSTPAGSPLVVEGSATDCDACLFAWDLIENPGGQGSLSPGATAAKPVFMAKAKGQYLVRLIVTSAAGCISAASETTITATAPLVPTLTRLALNDGASTTTSASVRLDSDAGGIVTHYMASENKAFRNAEWKAFVSTPSFSLSSGRGTKTVYFKVKNESGESAVGSDSISSQPTVEILRFAIAAGAATTASRETTLDTEASTVPTEMIASENPDFLGADWQPYQAVAAFELSSGKGTKTVFIKLRRGTDESSVANDTVKVR